MLTTQESERLSPEESPKAVTHSRTYACVRCQQRKVKCDRNNPCSTCVRYRVECISPVSIQPRRRKKRFPEAVLLARLRRYEEALKSYGADVDALKRDDGTVDVKDEKGAVVAVQLADGGKWISNDQSQQTERSLALSKNEFMDIEEVLQGSSEDELLEAPITTTWQSINMNNETLLLFGSQHTRTDLKSLHPPPMHIIRLWQYYLDNINPLVKVLHGPTFQQQVLEASVDIGNVPRDMEALLFSIYSLAMTSIDNAQCRSVFGDEKGDLFARYQFGAQQALLNADFLRPSTLVVLQALLLYLISVQRDVDPRSLSCLTSVAVRIAQEMGLHRNDSSQKFGPFDTEMRRRLWWQIVNYDSRVVEFSGVGTTIVTHQWNTRMPLNVNDSDLYPDMQELPLEHSGCTEMVFCLIKCEIAQFLQQIRSRIAFNGFCNELSNPLISSSAKDKRIGELEDLLERKYLRRCDSSIPLHFITTAFTRSLICKLRFISHHPRLLPDRGTQLAQSEKDRIFIWALDMIEYGKTIESNKSTQRFLWYTSRNKPMEAYIYVLNELRFRMNDDLAERAWRLFLDFFNFGFASPTFDQKPTPLRLAFVNLAIKAWDARESFLRQSQSLVQPPAFISEMRALLDLERSGTSDIPSESTMFSMNGEGFEANSFPDLYQAHQPDVIEAKGSVDLSMLMGSLPMDNSMDWFSWNDFAQT